MIPDMEKVFPEYWRNIEGMAAKSGTSLKVTEAQARYFFTAGWKAHIAAVKKIEALFGD